LIIFFTAEVSSNKFLGLAIISPLFSAYFILEQTISVFKINSEVEKIYIYLYSTSL